MKIKVSELQGAALDWAVAKCEGWIDDWNSWMYESSVADIAESGSYHPSTDWALAGPIIERERIHICPVFMDDCAHTQAWVDGRNTDKSYGSTPLIATMRCYVARKMGDEIEIPDKLINDQRRLTCNTR